MRDRKTEQGFTLVELIVVIIILGILATIASIGYINLSNSAQTVACRANQLALQTAQIMYFTTQYQEGEGHYAESLDLLRPFLRSETIPQCPNGGEYRLLSGGKVSCTIERHQL